MSKTISFSTSCPVGGACAVDGKMWLLSEGSKNLTIRDAKSGTSLSKIDLLDEGVAIAAVGSKVWVSTVTNKVFVFDTEGTLLGALQPGNNTIRKFFVLNSQTLFTSGDGKDFVKWNTTQFTVERVFLGRTPGEVVTDIKFANESSGTILVSSTRSIRLWNGEGSCLAEVPEGAVSIVHFFDEKEARGRVWAAQNGWIAVFSLPSATSSTQFVREKTLPASKLAHLSHTVGDHIVSLDTENVVTVWDARTLNSVETLRPPEKKESGSPSKTSTKTSESSSKSSDEKKNFTVAAFATHSSTQWSIKGKRGFIWTDSQEAVHDAEDAAASEARNAVQKDEVQYLKRKLRLLENIGNNYRQKAGTLFRQDPYRLEEFNGIDREYSQALNSWHQDGSNTEPMPDHEVHDVATAGGDFTEYWKDKYKEAIHDLEMLRKENEGMLTLVQAQEEGGSSDSDVKRAHHICQIIKEKNDLKEHARQLSEDVGRLRAKLRDYETPLAGRRQPDDDAVALRQTNEELRAEIARLAAKSEADNAAIQESQSTLKHNQILKQRVKKLRSELDEAQMKVSEQTATVQQDMQGLLETVARLEGEVASQRTAAAEAELGKSNAELAMTQKHAVIERLQALSEAAERELSQRETVDKAAQSQVRGEIELLCHSLDDRDQRLSDLLAKFNSTAGDLKQRTLEASEAKAALNAKELEMEAQQNRIDQLEEIIADRKAYGRVVGELQGRLELLVEELRRSFTPAQFAENVDSLENRVASLFSLESQLRQKDDIIAIKEDETLRLKEHLQQLHQQMNKVSSVFLHLPKTVEEVELLMVEVDEYRRRLGLDPETQEMIQIRLLELQAKRKAGAKVMDDLLPKPVEGSAAVELHRLQELANTMNAIAEGAAAPDKTGLV